MAVTVVAGFLFARAFGQSDYYGALAGAGTAVCGASATLATSTVLPAYKGKEADVAFVVVAVNALSTVAMVLYPPLCALLGFRRPADRHHARRDHPRRRAGRRRRLRGVGAGRQHRRDRQAVPRVPAAAGGAGDRLVVPAAASRRLAALKVPIPVFALVFLALCIVNSVLSAMPRAAARLCSRSRPCSVDVSTWGLLIAIGALGLGTSISAIATLGWRHVATVTGTTVVILGCRDGRPAVDRDDAMPTLTLAQARRARRRAR